MFIQLIRLEMLSCWDMAAAARLHLQKQWHIFLVLHHVWAIPCDVDQLDRRLAAVQEEAQRLLPAQQSNALLCDLHDR